MTTVRTCEILQLTRWYCNLNPAGQEVITVGVTEWSSLDELGGCDVLELRSIRAGNPTCSFVICELAQHPTPSCQSNVASPMSALASSPT
jgi:hypothetical protein